MRRRASKEGSDLLGARALLLLCAISNEETELDESDRRGVKTGFRLSLLAEKRLKSQKRHYRHKY